MLTKGFLVELLRALYGSDLRGGGGGVKSGGLDLVNLRGEVPIHEVGHEVEVEDLPHGDVADGSDEVIVTPRILRQGFSEGISPAIFLGFSVAGGLMNCSRVC